MLELVLFIIITCRATVVYSKRKIVIQNFQIRILKIKEQNCSTIKVLFNMFDGLPHILTTG